MVTVHLGMSFTSRIKLFPLQVDVERCKNSLGYEQGAFFKKGEQVIILNSTQQQVTLTKLRPKTNTGTGTGSELK